MKRSGGFSLVELMVAMVIGLIIILGAGQLFLTVFQTNRQVETLSEKQAAVNFSIESLLRDIRRAYPESIDWSEVNGKNRLLLRVPNRGSMDCGEDMVDVSKAYSISDALVGQGLGRALELARVCGDEEPTGYEQLVVGFEDDDEAFVVDDTLLEQGILVVTLLLMPTGQGGAEDQLIFHAVNRVAALTP